jgi:hypothetical protein
MAHASSAAADTGDTAYVRGRASRGFCVRIYIYDAAVRTRARSVMCHAGSHEGSYGVHVHFCTVFVSKTT